MDERIQKYEEKMKKTLATFGDTFKATKGLN